MRRLALLSLLATGCMRIYPDSELPDLRVHWTEGDCRPETPSVRVTVSLLDDTLVTEQTVACDALRMTFADVTPARYKVESSLLLADGEAFSAWYNELDMRDGFDADEYVYFGGGGNLRIAWVFETGATCSSLGADLMLIEIDDPSVGPQTSYTSCSLSPWIGSAFGTGLTLQLFALESEAFETRAVSPVVGPFDADVDGLTNLGTVTLAPCAPCPEPP